MRQSQVLDKGHARRGAKRGGFSLLRADKETSMSRTVQVGNLPNFATEPALAARFAEYGKVISVKLITTAPTVAASARLTW